MTRIKVCFVFFTCNVLSVLFSRNSTNLFTTPGVLMTSSMGGFGSVEQQTGIARFGKCSRTGKLKQTRGKIKEDEACWYRKIISDEVM